MRSLREATSPTFVVLTKNLPLSWGRKCYWDVLKDEHGLIPFLGKKGDIATITGVIVYETGERLFEFAEGMRAGVGLSRNQFEFVELPAVQSTLLQEPVESINEENNS